jgi:hypothetical protein
LQPSPTVKIPPAPFAKRGRYLVPERKVMFRQNPNIETRNSKQIRIPNDKGYGK